MDLHVINYDTLSRIDSPGQRSSNLDLILASSDLADSLGYNQVRDTWGSDYHPIKFFTSFTPKPYKKMTNRLSTKKTDWSKYVEIMRNKWTKYADLEDTLLSTDHLLVYESLTEDMRDAVMSASKNDSFVSSQSFPSESQSGTPKHWGNPVEWWDSECIEVVTNRAASLKNLNNQVYM
ncbi:unnamed protein product [Lasius platythorax]|uniref:Uncharacterized protein n=1 Tax=Lasius platythorax TaxID=488582 RepID=A0AAV2MYH8_9HYME